MSDKNWKDEMTTVKVSRLTYEVFNILQKRYKKKRLADGIAAFIEDTEPNLLNLAEEVLTIKERLDSIYDEETSSNKSESETDK